ncbi:hypothetical protein EVAR_37563_1 [Eumeta japonica]|uniref:Secreted protein n=1 Tax=Eumeta variegata TaxID=151549 RepID=A0A4C1XQG7_EUMVA|nr:hypothetical protein EVAR_37563_1 [Eumeta japonica]
MRSSATYSLSLCLFLFPLPRSVERLKQQCYHTLSISSEFCLVAHGRARTTYHRYSSKLLFLAITLLTAHRAAIVTRRSTCSHTYVNTCVRAHITRVYVLKRPPGRRPSCVPALPRTLRRVATPSAG